MSESFEISLTLARPNVIFFALQQSHRRHCEERSDVAIHGANADRLVLWIAASACGLLAMTAKS